MPVTLRTAARAAAALIAFTGVAGASPSTWTADPARSRIVVHVQKRGVLSGLAHDHHFVATSWRASATFDPAAPAGARVDVVVLADSLRDGQPALSAGDREKVNRQAAGSGVLDAAHHPEIRFASSGPLRAAAAAAAAPGPAGAVGGELAGTLSLRGRARPLTVPVHATRDGDGWRVRGTARFRQSDFGIAPYSGFLGTIAVHDEVTVEWDLVLVPAR